MPTDSEPSPPSAAPYDPVATELAYIKQHTSYRLARRLARSRAYDALRWLKDGGRRMVTLRALGERHPASQGSEVWLLSACPNVGEPPVPWDFVGRGPGWAERTVTGGAFGRCLLTDTTATLRIPVDRDPELRFLSHGWSGRVEVRFGGQRQVIDLFAADGGDVRVFPARREMAISRSAAGVDAATVVPVAAHADADEALVAAGRAGQIGALAVHCPRWLGVTASTQALFPHTYAVPPTADREPYDYPASALRHHADVIGAAGVRHVIFSGGDGIQLMLARMLRERDPQVRCDLLWHGPYYFFSKDYDWQILTDWITAARAGEVHTIATVKAGMEQFFAAAGVRSRLVVNYLADEVGGSELAAGPPHHVGMWFSGTQWKPPHAMLAALKLAGDCRLHAINLGGRAREVCAFFDIPIAEWHERPLPRRELHAAMRRTHATLYVTFTECSPMLPLESFAQGVPCLVGPASHLFEDDPWLFERLVVPFPDRAEVIARYLTRVIAERADILARYRVWLPEYNRRARGLVEELLRREADA